MAKPSDPGRVTAIILAAGSSMRLGRPKQLLDWHGRPLIRHMAGIALASRVDYVAVVTGPHEDEMSAALEDLPIRLVPNPDNHMGQSTSLRAGLASLSQQTDAVVVLLVDQPAIKTSSIDDVVDIWRDRGPKIVQARYDSIPAHPVLFARSLFADLDQVRGDEGARSILRTNRAEIEYADIAGPPPFDIDTEDDYQAALVSSA